MHVGWSASGLGRRTFLVERVAQVADDHVLVSADGLAGACFGDSGGPLLVRGDDGRVRTLGLLSQGSSDCRGTDRYLRVDALADWLAREAGVIASDGGEEPLASPALGAEGRCFGPLAAWDERGALRAEVCAGSRRCGWDRDDAGQRCIRAADDACDGIDELGACREGSALRCVRGVVTRNPCATCGFECMRSPKTGLPVCLDLPGSRDGG